ncbi:hypothetical protein ACSBOB_17310 [Mesorhizobium sp. ASY16-5R]|uniref:hypothetical protein n=1 Tax=Mesorhizobium sp. ASY16-5R TaxID=3445772 RepID=UPI003F9FF927
MGVISFDKTGEVWGASSRIIYAMLHDMMDMAGPRPFLTAFIQAFDHGYNAIGLDEVSLAEHQEFSTLVRRFVQTGKWRGYAQGKMEQFELDVMLQRLEQLTEASLAVRHAAARQQRGN